MWMIFQKSLKSKLFPKVIFSIIDPEKIYGSCSTYATFPLNFSSPVDVAISPSMQLNKVDFPDPIYPIRPICFPF